MNQDITKRGPFAAGPLSVWQVENLGAAVPAGVVLPDLPELWDDEPTPPPFIERSGSVVTLHFHDVARIRINLSQRRITGFDIDPETDERTISHIFHDHVAPRLLAELGHLVLHGSAVRFGDRTALFLGESGGGKSTLGTSLHRAGHQLLGDDAMIVTGDGDDYRLQAVYPSLRLYPEVIASLLGDVAAATAPMAGYSDKLHVELPDMPDNAGAPLPLTAIFFLSGECGATVAAASPLDSTLACIKLVEQSFTLDPRDPRCAARRLAALSRLSLAVPVYTLSYPHDFARLGEVHAEIEAIMNACGPDQNAPPKESLAR